MFHRIISIFALTFLLTSNANAAKQRSTTIQIVETTDVHGCFFPWNFITNKPAKGSLARVAALVNKHPENDYWVVFNCPEFTSLCPITGQPDFAEIKIKYIPDVRMVESKSLKLYLFSFRNHGDFHEDCVNIIMKDLIRLMDPKYIEVTGLFTPRGGISIHPFANYGRPGTRYEAMAEKRFSNYLM